MRGRNIIRNLDLLNILVHARDTEIALDSKTNEAIVTPVRAPRVLNDPVVLVISRRAGGLNRRVGATMAIWTSISVSFEFLVFIRALFLSSFATSGPSALSIELLRAIFVVSTSSDVQADDNDTVVKVGRAVTL